MCQNIFKILEKDNIKLTRLILCLQTIYKATNVKRGLIDAIGTISKTLFGTIDTGDTRKIQLELLQTQQNAVQHVARNQIKVINATIGHLETLKKKTLM